MTLDGIDGQKSDEGNTETSSDKKQVSQRMHWHFTFNNYLMEDIDVLDGLFRQICTDWAFQEEIGEKTKTPHLQGAIRLKKAMRFTEFTPNKKIHWQPQRYTHEYALKSETRKPNGIQRYGGLYKPAVELKLISENSLYDWQEELLSVIKSENDDRKVYWYWETTGNVGKSQFTKLCVAKYNCIPAISGKYADIINLVFKQDMDKCRCIIFDIPRNNGNSVSYSAIESIKNGLVVNTKYETGYKMFNPPVVIVFSNSPPEEHKLSADKWVIREITMQRS